MTDTANKGALKIHPMSREMLPDDPMEMHGFQVQGDPDLMLRMLVEEYARIGWHAEQIMQLAHDPNYAAFHGLASLYGEEELRRRVAEILARCGVTRVKAVEAEPLPELVQLELPK